MSAWRRQVGRARAVIGSLRVGVGLLVALVAMGCSPLVVGASASAADLYSFGSNEVGQLGNATNNGTIHPNPVPAVVTLPGSTGPVTQIAAGLDHSLAVTATGQLYAFGYNPFGQLGNATSNGTGASNPVPSLVSLPNATGGVVQASGGSGHSLAVTSTGELYAFGVNGFGQLGSAANNAANPMPALVRLPGATGPVVQASAGGDFSLAVTSTGQLYSFGGNQLGELGVATNSGTLNPNPTPELVTLPGVTGPVVQAAAGSDHTLALTSTGQMYAFGYNYYGQLGNTTNNATNSPNPAPSLITLPGSAGTPVQIAGGGAHSLVLTSTGQLYAFGSNLYGQLGNATNKGTDRPNPAPARVTLPGAAGRVVQIAAGREDSFAVTSTGQLYSFGANDFGQLGDAIGVGTQNANPLPSLVNIPGSSGHTLQVAPGGLHTLAVVPPPPPPGPGPPIPPPQVSGCTPHPGMPPCPPQVLARIPPRGGVPSLSALRVSPGTFATAGRLVGGHCVSVTRADRGRRRCARPIALKVSFKLTVAATVTSTIEHTVAGRAVTRRCVAATRHNRKARRCTRLLVLGGRITRRAHAGLNSFLVTAGRLAPGAYRVTATPSLGGEAGTTASVAFRVAR